MTDARPGGVRGWLARTLPILPVLIAEAILWLGFGALLPVLPLYITEQGIDTATLGWIVAAWPAARLLGEPLFGWLGDRGDKRLLMLGGLLVTAVVVPMPLVLTGSPPSCSPGPWRALPPPPMTRPRVRYILDATPPDGARVRRSGSTARPRWAACSWGRRSGELVRPSAAGTSSRSSSAAWPWSPPPCCWASRSCVAPSPFTWPTPMPLPGGGREDAPTSLWNRLLVAAIVINVGSYFASGTYEVIWSLWMTELGADLGLVGLTFAAFGLGVLRALARRRPLVRPAWARSSSSSSGASAPRPAGSSTRSSATRSWSCPSCSSRGSRSRSWARRSMRSWPAAPRPARSTTTQGVYGAAGTLGMIVASIAAGALFAVDIHLPFYVFAVVMVVSLGLGLLIGGRPLAREGLGAGSATSPGARSRRGAPSEAVAAREQGDDVRRGGPGVTSSRPTSSGGPHRGRLPHDARLVPADGGGAARPRRRGRGRRADLHARLGPLRRPRPGPGHDACRSGAPRCRRAQRGDPRESAARRSCTSATAPAECSGAS